MFYSVVTLLNIPRINLGQEHVYLSPDFAKSFHRLYFFDFQYLEHFVTNVLDFHEFFGAFIHNLEEICDKIDLSFNLERVSNEKRCY